MFLEVLDRGFHSQNVPTTSQRRINCFHVSVFTISSTMQVCISILIFTKYHQNLEMYLWNIVIKSWTFKKCSTTELQ